MARSPLERRDGETWVAHRAMLLFAMQTPARRSNRATARAVHRTEGAVRKWSRAHEWSQRITGGDVAIRAVNLYRSLYLADYGAAELPLIANRADVELATRPSVRPPELHTAEAARSAVANAVDGQIVSEVAKRRKAQEEGTRKRRLVVEGAWGTVAKQLNDGKIKARIADIKTLVELDAMLSADPQAHTGGAVAVETTRLRMAREGGGDVLEAIETDLRDLTVIVGALRQRDYDAVAQPEATPQPAVEQARPTLAVVGE